MRPPIYGRVRASQNGASQTRRENAGRNACEERRIRRDDDRDKFGDRARTQITFRFLGKRETKLLPPDHLTAVHRAQFPNEITFQRWGEKKTITEGREKENRARMR